MSDVICSILLITVTFELLSQSPHNVRCKEKHIKPQLQEYSPIIMYMCVHDWSTMLSTPVLSHTSVCPAHKTLR